ncbi:DUF4214 domain-containing protein [Sphingomonas sp. UYEF23]|uniref:DUF4214 domain-containing protein n=1 Tax=Sphingomonas sp. UYEF23 TaxID=1756408 RepID=UPI00339B1FCA
MEATKFVRASYRKVLGRWPEPSELTNHTSALRLGIGRQRLLADIATSAEYESRQKSLLANGDDADCVRHLYETLLGRAPEAEEMNSHLERLRAGRARELICEDIAHSAEARSAATFWSDLSRLVVEEKRGASRFLGWLGRNRRETRNHNRERELAYRQVESLENAVASTTEQVRALASKTGNLNAVLRQEIGRVRRQVKATDQRLSGLGRHLESIRLAVERIDASKPDHHFDALTQTLFCSAEEENGWRDTVDASLERLEKRSAEHLAAIEFFNSSKLSHPLAYVNQTDLSALGQRSRSAVIRLNNVFQNSFILSDANAFDY